MFCVCVTFEVAPENHDRFIAHVRTFAEASRQEEGCRTFEVWAEHGQPGVIFLYETYADRACFDAHLASSHFKSFDADATLYRRRISIVTWDTLV